MFIDHPFYILVIEQEKGHQKFVQGIENFDTSNLKHAETMEKNPLPTKEGNNFSYISKVTDGKIIYIFYLFKL